MHWSGTRSLNSDSRLIYLFQYDFGHKTYSVIYLLTRIYNRRTRIHGWYWIMWLQNNTFIFDLWTHGITSIHTATVQHWWQRHPVQSNQYIKKAVYCHQEVHTRNPEVHTVPGNAADEKPRSKHCTRNAADEKPTYIGLVCLLSAWLW